MARHAELSHRVTPTACLTYDPASGGTAADGGESRGAFVVRTVGPVRKGEALSICYGTKENAELLVAYGFALRPNPSDTSGLRVGGPPDDPLRALKLQARPPPLAAPATAPTASTRAQRQSRA